MRPDTLLPLILTVFVTGCSVTTTQTRILPQHALKAITINTNAYPVAPGTVDRRSVKLVAPEDMHIVAIEHFNGVQKGGWSDNGHLLSLNPDNPWVKWQDAGTGMEPTGATGYFGYCGRDYYTEVSGINDVVMYEVLPATAHFLIPKGATLHLHTYAHNFLETPQAFHHAVRLLYW